MIRRFHRLVCSFVWAALLAAPTSAAPDLPSVKAGFAASPPVIDGELDDVAWRHAGRISDFRVTRTGQPVKHQTAVLIAYGESALYLGVRCAEPHPAGIVTKATREMEVFADDAVGIMLDPGEKDTYYQFGVTAGGVDFDQKVITAPVEKKLYADFEPDWDVKTGILKDGWVAEMKIPYTALGTTAQMNRTWRMNSFRIRPQDAYEKSSIWSYALSSHARESWGKVHGITFGAVSSGGLRLDRLVTDPGRIGTNSLTIAFADDLPRGTETVVTVQAPSGSRKQFKGRSDQRIPFRIEAHEGIHQLSFTVLDNRGRLLFESPPATIEVGALLDSYVERNYYTKERQAGVVCLASELDDLTLQHASLEVGVDKTDIKKIVPPPLARRTRVELSLSGVDPGDYTVSVSMHNRDGVVIATQDVQLRKLNPGQGSEVKIVRRDRGAFLLVNGAPYLMLGIDSYQYPGEMEDLIAEIAESGFNMISLSSTAYYRDEEGTSRLVSIMDACRKHGVKARLYPQWLPWKLGDKENWKYRERFQKCYEWEFWARDTDGLTPDDSPDMKRIHENVNHWRNWVTDLINHPALLMYRGFDEADDRSRRGDEIFMNFLRDIDPYHPVERPFGPGLITDHHGDVYEVHRYIRSDKPMNVVWGAASSNKPIADRKRKPMTMALGAKASGEFRGKSPAEIRCQMYLALIGGGRGFMWFNGRHPYLSCWNAIKRVTKEVSKMAPVLLEPDIPQEMTVKQPSSKPVYAWVMRYDGHRWIMAANSRKAPVEATFVLPGLQDTTRVNVHFEDRRTLNAKDGHLYDRFGAYGVHVYEFLE